MFLYNSDLHYFILFCSFVFCYQLPFSRQQGLSLYDINLFGFMKIFTDYKKTTLKNSVEIFENFVQKLEKSWKGKLLEQSGECQ